MFKRFLFLCVALAWAFSPGLSAQGASPLSIRDVRHSSDGVDRVFTFAVDNALDQEIDLHGRVVAISVYGTSLPDELPIEGVRVPARGSAEVSVRWHDAPLVGRIRVLVVLNEGAPSFVNAPYAAWLLPDPKAVGLVFAALLLFLLVILLWRRLRNRKLAQPNIEKPKKAVPPPSKPRVPANMLPYIVEPDDTVMTLTSRFDVTWQDLARANRLKPPYALVPGKTLLIPRHAIKGKPPGPPVSKT